MVSQIVMEQQYQKQMVHILQEYLQQKSQDSPVVPLTTIVHISQVLQAQIMVTTLPLPQTAVLPQVVLVQDQKQ